MKETLLKNFSSYEIKFSDNEKFAEIINPFYLENIKVEYLPEEDFTPYTVYFAFQHYHMSSKEDVVEYIKDIINENIFSIEFFKDGRDCFGGDITAQELKDLTYESLEQHTGYYGSTKLKECADSFKLRGWNSDKNFDAIFIVDDKESVMIKKLD